MSPVPQLNFDTLADDYIRTLNLPPASFAKPLCIILVGIPASGKTRLVNKLAEKFPLAILKEEDLIAYLAPRATVIQRNSPEVFKLAFKAIEHIAKAGKACIYDANVKTNEQRALIRNIIQEVGGRFLLIYLNCPRQICYERLEKHNLAVSRGEAKGFILNKDLFEYEVASTSLPSLDEQYVTYNCENPEGVFQILPLVENKLKESGKLQR